MLDRDEINFCGFLAAMRKKQNVTLEMLCEGLCSVSMMGRILKGERLPDKLMRDRFLARLGVSGDGYEDFLDLKEYKLWKSRQDILRCVEEKDIAEAERLLEQYARCGEGHAVSEQFILAMKAQLLRYQNAPAEEQRQVVERAVRLTVPAAGGRKLGKLLLSEQELDLVLEDIHLQDKYTWPPKQQRYEEMLSYIEASRVDDFARVKIYPKAAYYLAAFILDEMPTDLLRSRALVVCNRAIELLRDTRKAYYLWELLLMREKLIARPDAALQETREWRSTLEEIYRENGVSVEMESCCYLYRESEAYCIGDVIRIRREMFGMTKKLLCEGICSEKTMGRIEKNQVKVQMAIVRALLKKLGLSPEYTRAEIVTDSYEALLLQERFVRCSNGRELEEAGRLLGKLEGMLDMDNPVNSQFIKRHRVLCAYKEGKLPQRECIEGLQEVLTDTLPLDIAMHQREKYLTKHELTCIYNIATHIDTGNAAPYIRILQEAYERHLSLGDIGSYIMIFELIMTGVASLLGNMGMYDQSDMLAGEIVRVCLQSRRLNQIHMNLYNAWWNCRKRMEQGIPAPPGYDGREQLKRCITLSSMCKALHHKKFYEGKIENIQDS